MALCDCWDKTFTFLHDHLWKIMAKSTNEVVSGYSMSIRFSILVQKVQCVENKVMVVVRVEARSGATVGIHPNHFEIHPNPIPTGHVM